MELTKEVIAEAVKAAVAEEIKKLKEPIKKFQPGDPDIKVIKDEGDQKFPSLGAQLQAVRDAYEKGMVDPRLYKMAVNDSGIVLKATGLSEGVPAEGGFLIQAEFVPKLLARVYETGVLVAKVDRQKVGANSNGMVYPADAETSRADGSRAGGIQMYWAAEAGTKIASLPQFRRVSLELKKLIGLCYVTDELLQDATGLEAYINKKFAEEMGFKLDDAIVNGTGAGQPIGILTSPCLVTVAKEGGQAAATVVSANIIKMRARLWAKSRKNSAWLINQDIEPQLHMLNLAVGTGVIPVYMPMNGLSSEPYDTLYGRPVIPIEQCATLGAVGDIIYADLSQYLMIDKGEMQGASSIHVKFVYDETAFRFVYRCDGQPWWNSALTPYKGTNTQSPFVALALRA